MPSDGAILTRGLRLRRLVVLFGATLGGAAAVACTALLGNGFEIAADAGAPRTDARGRDSGAAPDASREAGHDACGGDAIPTTKPELEANLCGGFACVPGSNSQLANNAHCHLEAGAPYCTLPTYIEGGAPDGAHDAVAVADAGHAEAGHADAALDTGPTLPLCSALPTLAGGFTYPPNVIYAIGSTAIQPYVGHIAQILAAGQAGTSNAATIIYAGAGSCVGVQAAYAPAGMSPPAINTLASTASYYGPTLDENGNPVEYTCVLDSAQPADLGVSDVFPSSCTGLPFDPPSDPLPAPYYDFFGPIQVMEMLVPTGSSATTITYEETGLVWGYGSAAQVMPWTDDGLLFIRSAASGTQTMISLAVGLDPRAWVGVAEASNTAVKSALLAVPTTSSSQALGILASDVADGIRQSARPLAFQDRGESCAWLPDTSLSSFDKRNVRDGHYPIWGPSHFITTVNSMFVASPTVAKLIAALNGSDPDIAKVLDVIALYATNHVVPSCAMHVARTSDGQGYAPYQPPGSSSCSCYYDDQVPQDTTTCTPCTSDDDCTSAPAGATSCNFFGLPLKGYCEPPGSGS